MQSKKKGEIVNKRVDWHGHPTVIPGLCSDHFNEKFINKTIQVVKLRDYAIQPDLKIFQNTKEGNYSFKIII